MAQILSIPEANVLTKGPVPRKFVVGNNRSQTTPVANPAEAARSANLDARNGHLTKVMVYTTGVCYPVSLKTEEKSCSFSIQ